jgi:PPOX class probable F420-dependent enzyme
MDLPEDVVELLRKPSICFLTTLMADGSPQVTETWVDTDGKNVVINTVQSHQKVRNVERDARVAVAVADRDNPSRYVEIRGRVADLTETGGAEHIDQMSHKYLGRPYPSFGGSGQVRVIMTIEAEKVRAPRR